MHHNRLPNTIDYGGDLLVTSVDQPALQRQLALKGCNFRQLAFIFHRPAPPSRGHRRVVLQHQADWPHHRPLLWPNRDQGALTKP